MEKNYSLFCFTVFHCVVHRVTLWKYIVCFVALCCALLYTELRCRKELFAVLFHRVPLCCTLSNTVEIFFLCFVAPCFTLSYAVEKNYSLFCFTVFHCVVH